MKLAEALSRRADAVRRMSQLETRIARNAQHQEGEEPPEDPDVLLEEHRSVADELQSLMEAINRTNARTRMTDGRTLTEALAARDVLRMRHSMLRRVVDATTPNLRYSRTEIRMIRRLDAAALERAADELARDIRQLDLAIQETNWTSQLQE